MWNNYKVSRFDFVIPLAPYGKYKRWLKFGVWTIEKLILKMLLPQSFLMQRRHSGCTWLDVCFRNSEERGSWESSL